MKKLLIIPAIAASFMTTTASAYESAPSHTSFIAKRDNVENIISHAHYSSHNRGVATMLTEMADRAHKSGFTTQAINYINHAQTVATLDLKSINHGR